MLLCRTLICDAPAAAVASIEGEQRMVVAFRKTVNLMLRASKILFDYRRGEKAALRIVVQIMNQGFFRHGGAGKEKKG